MSHQRLSGHITLHAGACWWAWQMTAAASNRLLQACQPGLVFGQGTLSGFTERTMQGNRGQCRHDLGRSEAEQACVRGGGRSPKTAAGAVA